MSARARTARGFTLAELLTALVVVAVLTAVAIPLWRNHILRVQRSDAIAALVAVQNGEDEYFGRNARYADAAQLALPPPGGLGLSNRSKRGFYQVELRSSADGLAYLATARATPQSGQSEDSRCVEFTLDQNGRRQALDAAGDDRSSDCWH